MIEKIKGWYNGEFKIYESQDTEMPIPYIYHHWTAKVTRVLVRFYMDHWKWIWSMSVAVCSLLITFK